MSGTNNTPSIDTRAELAELVKRKAEIAVRFSLIANNLEISFDKYMLPI